ncbi:hypothetical protein OK016_01560 [Vibrio chagasii]|nr:hypothetical protein [Vibrio chagasii]
MTNNITLKVTLMLQTRTKLCLSSSTTCPLLNSTTEYLLNRYCPSACSVLGSQRKKVTAP